MTIKFIDYSTEYTWSSIGDNKFELISYEYGLKHGDLRCIAGDLYCVTSVISRFPFKSMISWELKESHNKYLADCGPDELKKKKEVFNKIFNISSINRNCMGFW